ncbi:MAG: TonB family protein [Acidobacteria bacterium]|nr:TonB family protein [Acidobacteriota bacterium]
MGKKVLIVNYEPKRLARLNELIVDLGYDAITAKDGIEALEVVEENVPDLAIIDPMLPKLSGFEVAQKLTAGHPRLPIIMVTSVYKGNRYRTEAMSKYGVKEYLEEPFEDETLQTLVKKYLDFSEKKTIPKKKSSAKRRLEEILEETMSGRVPTGGKSVSHKVKQSDGEVLTSADIFSDVIKDVEDAPGTLSASEKLKEEKEREQAKLEKKLEETLSGLKVSSSGKKKDRKKEEAEPKAASATGQAEQNSEAPLEPAVRKQEAEVKSEIPESKKSEARGKKKGKKGEGIEYGSYLLLEKVATGGMAELFKAKRRGVQGFQKIVAIKRILSHLVDNEEFVTMFIDEAKLAAQLNHPNIAQIYDLGKIDNSFYIAMEYVEGYDLRNILKECKKKKIRIPEPLVLFIAGKMLSALDYAHRKKGLDMKDLKIVHRDISPQNILISKGGDVKLVDFGIAKAATKASQTQAGALKGKLLYMSPEQAYGKPIDNRSDLFSLASVIYEAITGKKCFLSDSEIGILEKVRKVQYTPIKEVNPNVSEGTERLIARAFSKKIDDRFQSAKEMESELHHLMESLPFAVNERILAQFIHALYQGDLKTIEDISDRYSLKEEVLAGKEPEEVPEKVETAVPEESPEPVAAVSMDDLDGDSDINATMKMDSGTMIMPDLEEVEKHENEFLEQIGGGGRSSKTGLIVAIVLVAVIVVAIGFFAMKQKKGTISPVPVQKKVEKVSTPETTVPGNQPVPTQGEPEQTPAAQPAAVPGKTAMDLGIDKEKLVQELLKKKLAEGEAKLKAQRKANRAKAKPVKKTVAKVNQPVAVQQKPQTEKTAVPTAAVPKAAETKAAGTGTPATTKPAATAAPVQTVSGQPAETKPVGKITVPVETVAKRVETKPVETKAPVVTKPVEKKPVPQPIVPRVKEGDLVPLIKGEVIFPTPVKTVKARISPLDRRRNIHGEVLVQGLIDEKGNVVPGEVRVLRSTVKGRNSLGKAAVKAFKKWKFTPAMKDGVKVKVYFTHMFVF